MPQRISSSRATGSPKRAQRAAGAAAIALAALLAQPAAAPAAGPGGGAVFVSTPVIKQVRCVRACASRARPRAGSVLRISGRRLDAVTRIMFHGGSGTGDDKAVRPRTRSTRRVTVVVPLAARTGPVSAWVGNDVRSLRTDPVPILPPPPPLLSPELRPAPGPRDAGAPVLETGTSQVRYFLGAERGVRFSYRVSDSGPVRVQVDLVRASDGAVVRSWPATVTPGEVQTVAWDGLDGAGRPQPEGRYLFRVVASGASGAQARSSQVQDVQRDAFDLYGHIFPIRGRHDYGGDGSHFGAGRGGRSHQGQDVFARCGTRLVAARGGVVKFKQYHAAAGHYLVIDGYHSDVDFAYMHLEFPSPFSVGDRVHTGQEIGRVGDSGNASGCHLHFEMWGAPGWYDGGQPFDPYPHLLAWDGYS